MSDEKLINHMKAVIGNLEHQLERSKLQMKVERLALQIERIEYEIMYLDDIIKSLESYRMKNKYFEESKNKHLTNYVKRREQKRAELTEVNAKHLESQKAYEQSWS